MYYKLWNFKIFILNLWAGCDNYVTSSDNI